MNNDLHSYVKVYKNAFSDAVCDQTIDYLQNANWSKESFYFAGEDAYKSPTASLDISWDILPNDAEIIEIIKKNLNIYIEDLNFPWFGSWNGFTSAKYNRYSETHGMDLHCDHIHSMFDGQRKGVPILSILTRLNADFEGGEFVMFDEQVIPFNKGDVLIFPSNFLFPHKVNTVTAGVRYSAVFWAW
jgi:hypothetical protein